MNFVEHPLLPPVTRELVFEIAQKYKEDAPKKLAELNQQRRERIARAQNDPLRSGWSLPWYDDAERLLGEPQTRLLANLGGNGSGKSIWMIRRGLREAFSRPRAKVLFLHEDEDASIDVHQAMAYEMLPNEIRPTDDFKVKRTMKTNIAYSEKTGFIGQKITIGHSAGVAKIVFGNYRQALKRWEGGGWSFIGADENLPLKWLVTLLFRLGREGGKMVWSFTAIDGITPAVAETVKGAVTLQSRPVDTRLLPANHVVTEEQDWPKGHMPYIQQARRPEVKIIYAHSDMNPLSGYDPSQGRGANYGYEDLVRLCQARPLAERERRAYGYSRKSVGSVFPLFGAHHVLTAARMAEILRGAVTRYMVVDPAGARNFFIIWFAVDKHGRHFIYREWPDVPTLGEWAEAADDPGKWDGKPGPAQQSLGYGVRGYKRLILELEGWKWEGGEWRDGRDSGDGRDKGQRTAEEIFQRFIDPRSGATEAMAADAGESSLIDRFLEDQEDDAGNLVGPSMEFEPAESGRHEEDGLEQLNALIEYNPKEPICALLNEPKLYVSEECENVIWALTNYTAHDGAKAACKDPVDGCRYMALKKCLHVPKGSASGFKGGGYR